MSEFDQTPQEPVAAPDASVYQAPPQYQAPQPEFQQAPPPYQAPPAYQAPPVYGQPMYNAEPQLHVPSLIVGIVALILAFTTGFGGLILGIVGVILAKKAKETHKTTIGFVLSLIGLIIGAIVTIIFIVAIAFLGAVGFGLAGLL